MDEMFRRLFIDQGSQLLINFVRVKMFVDFLYLFVDPFSLSRVARLLMTNIVPPALPQAQAVI